MENKPEVPKDLKVQLNSDEGALWKQTAMQIKQKIAIGKIDAELNHVVLDYCEKKVEEDTKKVEEDLKTKK